MATAEIAISILLSLNLVVFVFIAVFLWRLNNTQRRILTFSRKGQDAFGQSQNLYRASYASMEDLVKKSIEIVNAMKSSVDDSLKQAEVFRAAQLKQVEYVIKQYETAARESDNHQRTTESLLKGIGRLAATQIQATKQLEKTISDYARANFGTNAPREDDTMTAIKLREELEDYIAVSGLPREAAKEEMRRKGIMDEEIGIEG